MDTLIQDWVGVSRWWAQLMLVWSWQSALLVGAIGFVARLWRSAPARARHGLWLAGMAAIAVLPLWASVAQSLPLRRPSAPPITDLLSPTIVPSLRIVLNSPPGEDAAADTESAQSGVAATTGGLLLGVVFLAWCAGALVCLIGVVRSHRRRLRLCKEAIRIRTVTSPRGLETSVGYSTGVVVPQLVGSLRPMILLPADIEDWSSAEEIRGVLLHELSHLDRRDPYVSLFQALLGSIFFFHPGVRYGLRQLSVERELACDEAVAGRGVDAGSYAEAILKVAERSVGMPDRHQIAFDTTRKILERRLHMILNPKTGQGPAGRAAAMAGVMVLFAAITCLLLPRSELAAASEVKSAELTEAGPAAILVPAPAPAPASPTRATTTAAAAIQAQAQQPQASLSGRVSDQTGALIPGVTVALTSGQRPFSVLSSVLTDESGAYTFPQLEPGSYGLTASLPGFQTIRYTGLQISAPYQQNVTLQVGAISTNIEVRASRTPGSPPPARPPVRIGGDIAQANLIFSPKPAYPDSTRASGIEGVVLLQAIIGVDGSIANPRVISGHPDLGKAAVEAVKQWRYTPTMLNGMPIEAITTITINFALSD